jgi:hypothetical protein
MSMNSIFVSVFVSGAVLFSSCNKPRGQEAVADASVMAMEEAAVKRGASQAANAGRKMIREGDVRFETGDLQKTRQAITARVRELKGYVSEDNTTHSEGHTEHQMTVRVPEPGFDQLMETVTRTASHVDHRSIRALDVTEEFIDVEARMKTKKQMEARYLELLAKATKVEELLNVERELGNLRAEIESMEGRLKFLQNQVSFSTLRITFYTKNISESGFGHKISNALTNGWSYLLSFLVLLMSLWPFVLILAVVLFLVIRKEKKG